MTGAGGYCGKHGLFIGRWCQDCRKPFLTALDLLETIPSPVVTTGARARKSRPKTKRNSRRTSS